MMVFDCAACWAILPDRLRSRSTIRARSSGPTGSLRGPEDGFQKAACRED